MPDCDFGSKGDVSESVRATFCIKTLLELTLASTIKSTYLATHEAITITGINKTKEMHAKHGHVKRDGNNNETECSSKEMAHKHILRGVRIDHPGHGGVYRGNAKITEEIPQLQQRQRPNPRNREQSHPLHTHRSTESQSSKHKPSPPIRGKHAILDILWFPGRRGRNDTRRMIFRFKDRPREHGEGSRKHERRIKEDQARLSDQCVIKSHEESAEEGTCLAGSAGAESEENQGNNGDAKNCG
jgi:hypothetical protein